MLANSTSGRREGTLTPNDTNGARGGRGGPPCIHNDSMLIRARMMAEARRERRHEGNRGNMRISITGVRIDAAGPKLLKP